MKMPQSQARRTVSRSRKGAKRSGPLRDWERLFDATSRLLVRLKTDGTVLYVNEAVAAVSGYSARELIGMSWWGTLFPAQRMNQVEGLYAQLQSDGVASREMEIVTRDGGHLQVAWNFVTTTGPGRSTGAILGIGACSKAARPPADPAADRLPSAGADELTFVADCARLSLEAIGLPISLVNRDGEILYANRAMHDFGSRTADQIHGLKFHEAMLTLPARIDADLLEQVKSSGRRATAIAPWGNRWATISADPVCDSAGALLGAVISVSDVTEIKQRAASLAESELRLRQIIEALPEATWVLDREGCTEMVNLRLAELLGSRSDDIPGRHFYSFLAPADVALFKKNLGPLRHGIPQSVALSLIRNDGSLLSVLLELAPLMDGGEYTGAIACVRDVTARRQIEESLDRYRRQLEESVGEHSRRLNEARAELSRREKLAVFGRVADTIVHEFRDPLSVMHNAVYYLRSVALPETTGKTRHYLEVLDRQVALATRTIGTLLAFSTQRAPERSPVAVSVLIERARAMVEVPPQVQVRLESDQVDECPRVLVDADQMGVVFGNLLLNSIQAMPDGGNLIIRIEPRAGETDCGRQVAVVVQDEGGGIPPVVMSRLFEPFLTTKPEHSGLGLTICKDFIERNRGFIRVESELGQGTTVTVLLPGCS